MKKIISFLNAKRISQFISASFAVLFLLVTTACSQPSISAKEGKSDTAKVAVQNPPPKVASPYRQDKDNVPEGQVTEFYDSIQPVEGGMNNYSDVDPRQNTSKADAKAEKLVQQASHPEADRFNSPLDAVKKELADEPIPERMQKFSKDIGNSAKKLAKDTSNESQKGIKNIKQNSKSFAENTKSTAESNADRLTQNLQNTADDTSDVMKSAADKLISKTQNGVDKAQDFIQDKTNSM
jgi:gas vesicle protein